MLYTIVEIEPSAPYYCKWAVVSDYSGHVWGVFTTIVDAVLYILACNNSSMLLSDDFI